MSIFARNGGLDGFATARNGGFSDFAKKSRQRGAPSQSPSEPRCATPQSWGYSFRRTDSSAPVVPRLRPPAGTLPHTALPTPEAKECSCEVDPRRSTSSKQSDWRYAAISSTRKWLRYKTRHREERFFCCPQSRSFWQRA